MKKTKYMYLVLTICLCMMFVLGGCSRIANIDSHTPDDIPSVTETPEIKTKISVETTPEVTEGPTNPVMDDLKELSIYSIDSQSAEKVEITALIDSGVELTPELIVDKVVESMADEAFIIGIDNITTKDDAIIVSFKDDQPPVTNVGSSVESEILDAIAQSLLDNLSDYHKVIYRVMGGPYESGHIQLNMDNVYLETK